jgi:hypothetical protein
MFSHSLKPKLPLKGISFGASGRWQFAVTKIHVLKSRRKEQMYCMGSPHLNFRRKFLELRQERWAEALGCIHHEHDVFALDLVRNGFQIPGWLNQKKKKKKRQYSITAVTVSFKKSVAKSIEEGNIMSI